MKEKAKLTKEDWIKAGFRALSKGGEQAIRIEAIAREIKVSKGSFYWHFKDLAALKKTMLEHWAKLATFDVIANISDIKATPKEKLLLIIEMSSGEKNVEYGGLRTEEAIRNWARHDKKAARVFAVVEKARLTFVRELFLQIGFDKNDSAMKARLLYAGLIGVEHLSIQNLSDMKADLVDLLEILCV